jgi:NAD(P)-dependent dehydrogenase (short-subunit alcohol dehydrogenase family)
MKLNGKVALITGAASGIGHAIAKRYLEADGRVVIADVDPAKAAQAANELADKKSAIGIRMDVFRFWSRAIGIGCLQGSNLDSKQEFIELL